MFEDIAKKILKKINYETERTGRHLPEDEPERSDRITPYKTELIDTYNNYISYVSLFYASNNRKDKQDTIQKIQAYRLKILRALISIDLKTNLPENLWDIIPIESVVHKDTPDNVVDNSEIYVQKSTPTEWVG